MIFHSAFGDTMSFSHHRIELAAAVVVAAVLAFPTASVAAEDGDSQCRVGIVALDSQAKSGSLVGSVERLVARAECETVSGVELRQIVEEKQAKPIDESTAEEFSGLSSRIGDGVHRFFYKSIETAVEKLEPDFELGLSNLHVLARRPDFADQIWQAGIILVRAYRKMEKTGKAKSVARRLVSTFPSMTPKSKNVPPDALDFIEKQRQKVAEASTKLKVEPVGGAGCKTYINGMKADSETYPVSAELTYNVTMDCGSSPGPVWKVSAEEGKRERVQLSGVDPLDVGMKDASFEERERAEFAMQVLAWWSGLPRVLGVTAQGSSGADESFLVVRQERDGDATWSDTADKKAIGKVLAKVWPELADDAGDAWKRKSSSGDVDSGGGSGKAAGWVFTGAGAALTAGSAAYLLFAVAPRAKEIRCSPNTGGTSPGDPACDGVDIVSFEEGELESAKGNLNTARVVGYTTLGVGTVALGYGIFRLATSGSSDSKSARLRLAPGPGLAGVSLRLEL